MDDKYGRVAALRPADTNEAELYEVPTGMEFVGLLSICNQDGSARTFRAALTLTSTAATGKDWLAYDESVPANTSTSIKVSLAAAQTIRVQAGTVDVVSFVLTGLLIDNR